ncbi:MFS transporter [Streptomyces sp. NPDC002537]
MKPGGADSLRRNRDFKLLSAGQGFSMLGSAASSLALPLLVLSSTQSPLQTGLVEAVWTAGLALACLPGGAVADRFDRRSVLLVGELGRVAASAVLAVAVLTGRTGLALLLAVGGVTGLLTGPCVAASLASLPQIVPEHKLRTALAVNRARGQAAYLLGPVLGGWLFTKSPSYPFWLDTMSFAASAVSVYAVRTSLKVPQADHEPGRRGNLGAGLRFIWRDKLLRRLALIAAVQNFALAGTYLAVVVAASSRQGASGLSVGSVTGASAVGALAGALLAPRLEKLLSPGLLFFVAGVACAVLVSAMALSGTAALLAVMWGGCSLALSLSGSLMTVARMVRTPTHLQGRMHSAFGLLLMAAPPLGSTLAGLLLEELSGPAVFFTFGLLLLPVALLTPRVRAADLAVGRAA